MKCNITIKGNGKTKWISETLKYKKFTGQVYKMNFKKEEKEKSHQSDRWFSVDVENKINLDTLF